MLLLLLLFPDFSKLRLAGRKQHLLRHPPLRVALALVLAPFDVAVAAAAVVAVRVAAGVVALVL